MKLFTILTLLFISTALLSACNVTARDGDTSVSVSDANNQDGYRHCPPGHAKKGWC